MPKDRRVHSLSFDRSRASPYPCSSSSRGAKQYTNELLSGSPEDTKEWQEVRCPICLEHPHNAVLLQCSSYDKGCRPYMCDTSYRHSNCLDQFLKTLGSTPENETAQENLPTSVDPSITREESSLPAQSRHDMRLLQPNLSCPLCRGEIYGYVVVEAARQFMNSKVRSCSCENCDFSANYSELRKHARSDHPSIRPTEVDPARQNQWQRLERIRGFRDFLSFMQPTVSEGNNENEVYSDDPSSMFLLLLGSYLIHEVEEFLFNSREHLLHENRSSFGSLRFRHNMETNHAPSHRSSNNLRSGRTYDPRFYVETYEPRFHVETIRDPRHDPRWNFNLRGERANHTPSRRNVENTHDPRRDPRWTGNLRDPRWNENLHTRRTNNGQGLLWRGQRRPTSNNQRR